MGDYNVILGVALVIAMIAFIDIANRLAMRHAEREQAEREKAERREES